MTVFVEGGGSQDKTRTACRKGFSVFFEKLLIGQSKPRIVACGDRDAAYRRFLGSMKDTEVFPLLLVDSEDPVASGRSAAAHLRQRDPWKDLPDRQVHLMVQCMESWFLADKAALETYYDDGFRASSLPRHERIEEIPKADVASGLDAATRETTKGKYHKTRHGFEILERIDPTKVSACSKFAEIFFNELLAKSERTST